MSERTENAPSPTTVSLVGGPADGRTYDVPPGVLELHFGGPRHRYRATDDPLVWAYVERPPRRRSAIPAPLSDT